SLLVAFDWLRHDPGHYASGPVYSTGPPREIDRAKVAGVRLESGPGGRERLLLDCVSGPSLVLRERARQAPSPALLPVTVIEVGSCLRPDERTWLAGVLRAWVSLAGPRSEGQ